MRVLVVEDDVAVASLVRRALGQLGATVRTAASAREGLLAARSERHDVIILDRVLPDVDGLEVCWQLRHDGIHTPILLTTVKGAVAERVEGLDAGADDYLPKPYAVSELLARVRALLRRHDGRVQTRLTAGDLVLDAEARRVTRGPQEIRLTPTEFGLLELLLRNAGAVLSREQIMDHVWDFAFRGESNVVDVYVRRLRAKIDRPFGRRSIETVHRVGYRLVADPPSRSPEAVDS